MANTSAASYPMIGGDGPYSYAHNSSFQRTAVESAQALINEGISENLDVKQLIFSSPSSPNSFSIADLGCSVGLNTLIAVQNIIESVKFKCLADDLCSEAVEFQVFFNDHVSNDFNTLFKSLPCDGQYFAAAVPGSFHGRLFPKASLHFAHSSYSLQWLSRVPKELLDKESPAWNKGRIFYIGAPSEVFEAYSDQFAKDMESFLNSRAQELVNGGLMALIIPCYPVGIPPSQCPMIVIIALLEATLMDMVNMGLVSEDKVDSFNLPKYYPTPQELRSLIDRYGCFSIKKMKPLVRNRGPVNESKIQDPILPLRTALEGPIKRHFGSKIIDELFDRYKKKFLESPIFSQVNKNQVQEMFVLLKHRVA
ncbi:hypothetical protein F0562_005319 [Nyssa sinensis]|uniref:S-adenosylmethionine-dependent methyltransferase n=1 Tax=Nyssa sinensis TaxID=561372 RepID=A0A5J5AIZ9_9ASTE|nr:hypothetical protein F0562_005319 [Nyssa sinensis]